MSGVAEEREFLLTSLRDLDAEHAAGDLTDADYHALRDQYTARAAAALRPKPVLTARSRHIRRDLAVKTAVVVLLAGLAGWAVANAAGERTATEQATGGLPEGSNDRITKAQALAREGKILDAVKVYDDLLRDDPDNPVALAQRGWLISQVDDSLVDSGLASIDRAIAVDPAYPDARFFRGVLLLQVKNEPKAAADEFQRALDAKPPPDLAEIIEDYRRQALERAAGVN